MIHWDPSRIAFTIPIIKLSIAWYGVLFAVGFFLGFQVFAYLFQYFLLGRPNFIKKDICWEKIKKEPRLYKEDDESTLFACNELINEMPDKQCLEHPLLYYAKKILPPEIFRKIKVRLTLETLFPDIFYSIKKRAVKFAETLSIYVILGTIIGARLGYLFFYLPIDTLWHDPLWIFKTRGGGLASHGAAIGILLSLAIFTKIAKRSYRGLRFFHVLDCVVVGACLTGVFIRIGNFINQEILGKVCMKPWAVVFMSPSDGSLAISRHPVQLYEAIAYLCIFIALFLLIKYQRRSNPGQISALFFTTLFSCRFFLEIFKERQSFWLNSTSLFSMGQWLSIPFILLGVVLLIKTSLSSRKWREVLYS